jgi:hypothetical protein
VGWAGLLLLLLQRRVRQLRWMLHLQDLHWQGGCVHGGVAVLRMC